ncbi:MAG: transposase family protein, partial [Planctomycetaceae bacterium]|nr:transposase family protein [Planctomycetaceae bacterium]
DIVGPMPVTQSGNRYLLTIMDRSSRMVKCIALPAISAPAIAEAFRNHWLLQFGTPIHILSDPRSQFTGFVFEMLAKLSGIEQLFTTAYHPETNGRLERFHRFLKQRLRCIAQEHKLDFLKMHDWDVFIPGISFAYNVTPNRMTNHSPYEIVFGKRVKLPLFSHFETDVNAVAEDVTERRQTAPGASGRFTMDAGHRAYVSKMAEYYDKMDKHIKANMLKYNKQRKTYFDKNRIDATEYQNMTEVWVDADERKVGNARKLPINRMHGTIIDRIGENAYTIQLTKSGKYMPVNVSQIYREIPVMANATKSEDGLTKAAKGSHRTGSKCEEAHTC